MNEVSTIVPTAKSEKVIYIIQRFASLSNHWMDYIYFYELEWARNALLSWRNTSTDEKYRIIKRTIT